jgi:copper chaperone
MQTIVVTAPDISCDHCKATIEREIGSMAGVQQVSVDVSGQRVTIAYDPVHVTEIDIIGRLDEEGYPVNAL